LVPFSKKPNPFASSAAGSLVLLSGADFDDPHLDDEKFRVAKAYKRQVIASLCIPM
jgi:hypothetical protein